MTPRRLEALVRRAARRAFDLSEADIPFVWPRGDHAAEGTDAAVALAPRLVARVRDELPKGREDAHRLMVSIFRSEAKKKKGRKKIEVANLKSNYERFRCNLSI